MGVYVRKDSPYFWILLEALREPGARRATRQSTRERTNILNIPENRPLAEKVYEARMYQLGMETHFSVQPKRVRRSATDGWTYIYFISDGEMVKIGRAINVVSRLSSMQTSSTKPLTVLATFLAHNSIEKRIHLKFKNMRVRGEWFRLTPTLQRFINDVREGRDVVSGLVVPKLRPGSRRVHADFEATETIQ